jgi:cytoskeletal protein RodZ
VSKAAYPYPPDEFDAPPDPDAPRGVHRAPRSAWSRWWPFLVVLVVVPALAWGAVTLLAQQGRLPDLPGGTPSGEVSEETTPSQTTETTEGGEASTPPAEPTEPTATEPTTTQTTPATAAPVLSTPVSVLNGAGISGLAGRTADKLEAAGFTAVTPGNATSKTPVASTVFYASADLESTARLVAQTIGVDAVALSPDDAGQGITVVLRSDPEA